MSIILNGTLSNVALNKTVTSVGGVPEANPITYVTNGDITSANYYGMVDSLSYVQIDLGTLYGINQITVWHYYLDSRIYNSTKTQVSANGVDWITIFDSAVSGTYTETASGKISTITPIAVRYIRDYTNGSSANISNHWVEIQAQGTSDYSVASTYIKKFLTSESWVVPGDVTSVKVLVVAGGGGGGGSFGGGGGGGGLIYNSTYSVTPNDTMAITVGTGGNGGTGVIDGYGSNGLNSIFGSLVAVGGGGGGSYYPSTGGSTEGKAGGSGGGASTSEEAFHATIGGASTSGQGNIGGNSFTRTPYIAGGGGGAGNIGGTAVTNGGNGGNGLSYDISGISTYYSGGGGGAAYTYSNGSLPGVAGLGGASDGKGGNAENAVAAIDNTGGGGGGGGYSNGNGGTGGSGIVIISYESAISPSFYPHSIGSALYGTLSSVYTWYVQWYQYPTNTSVINSTSNFTVNSVSIGVSGVDVSVTVYNLNDISRSGSVGFDPGIFTYKSLPTIRFYNVTLGTYVLAYNTELSTTVAGNSGNLITGSILHQQTLNVTVPFSWFESTNATWNVNISELVTIVETAVTQTNTRTSDNFVVPPIFNVKVRYQDAIATAKNIWVRKDDALSTVKTITVKNT